mmetsp:Transcript_40719/g.64053  ORF Transcript_40719/g.64053 Transcript_40719/m.64053 type:complete len:304 (+) Transcript_40719:57-968(+)
MKGLPTRGPGLLPQQLHPGSPGHAAAATAAPQRVATAVTWGTVGGVVAVAAVAGKGSQGFLRSRPRGQRRRETRVACAAVPAEKPFRTTLFTKAAPDGVSLGDCPFSHAVQIALKVKGVDYDVVPCGPNNKPPWLLQEVAGQMPCVVHQGIAHVETSQILKWIDMTFPGPSLAVPEDYAELVSRAAIFPAVAEYTKNSDSSKDDDLLVNLQMSLTRFRMHLFALPIGTRYAVSDTLTLADCELLAALYVIQSATASLKGWSLNDLPEKDEVRGYYERAAALPAFSQSCYPPNVGVQGWQMARQ